LRFLFLSNAAHRDQHRTMTLSTMEFLRRFVQHVLPRGFVRMRQSGFLANACRTARVALARTLLAAPSIAHRSVDCSYAQRPLCYKVMRDRGTRQQLSRFHAGLGSGSA
jgi:hypothetical protein